MMKYVECLWHLGQGLVTWFFVALILGIINMYIDKSKLLKKERKDLIKLLFVSLVFTLFGYSLVWFGIIRILD